MAGLAAGPPSPGPAVATPHEPPGPPAPSFQPRRSPTDALVAWAHALGLAGGVLLLVTTVLGSFSLLAFSWWMDEWMRGSGAPPWMMGWMGGWLTAWGWMAAAVAFVWGLLMSLLALSAAGQLKARAASPTGPGVLLLVVGVLGLLPTVAFLGFALVTIGGLLCVVAGILAISAGASGTFPP